MCGLSGGGSSVATKVHGKHGEYKEPCFPCGPSANFPFCIHRSLGRTYPFIWQYLDNKVCNLCVSVCCIPMLWFSPHVQPGVYVYVYVCVRAWVWPTQGLSGPVRSSTM